MSAQSEEWKARVMQSCERHDIPRHMAESLAAHVSVGRPVGGFLSALLSNDLMDAIGRADDNNVRLLKEYAMVLYNDTPSGCYGSRERFTEWQDKGGLAGIDAAVQS